MNDDNMKLTSNNIRHIGSQTAQAGEGNLRLLAEVFLGHRIPHQSSLASKQQHFERAPGYIMLDERQQEHMETLLYTAQPKDILRKSIYPCAIYLDEDSRMVHYERSFIETLTIGQEFTSKVEDLRNRPIILLPAHVDVGTDSLLHGISTEWAFDLLGSVVQIRLRKVCRADGSGIHHQPRVA